MAPPAPRSLLTGLLAAVVASSCGAGATGSSDDLSIAAIQGPGDRSPVTGSVVSTSGIVTGDFQDFDDDRTNDLGGFYLQSEASDDNARTSDGLFVFDGGSRVDVQVGQRVRVSGIVQEHYGETQLKAHNVAVTGDGSVAATDLHLPAPRLAENADGDLVADLEAYEGMLVRLPQGLTVTDLYELEAFGSVVLSEGGRLYQYTNRHSPGVTGYRSHRESNAARSIVLDDGRRDAGGAEIRYLEVDGGVLRTGDSVSELTGNLRYSRGSGGRGRETWRLMPIPAPVFVKENPRPAAPARTGNLRVVSLNVLNFFSGIDAGRPVCGTQGRDACRGADSQQEQRRQLAKLGSVVKSLDADIVALIEVENNATESLAMIVEAVNRAAGEQAYEALSTGVLGSDAIKTGFLYRPRTVVPLGEFALLTARIDPRFDDGRHRPALAQTFRPASGADALTVTVVHMKSKGSDCDAQGDVNRGDGQGNCNGTRTLGVQALAEWLAGDPTASGDPDHLVLGDFNAYYREDPLEPLRQAGFADLLVTADGRHYTYVYDGQAGALDHAFASGSAADKIAAAGSWAINADEARVHDYNLEHDRDPALFDPDSPFRSSDHDPLVVDFNLD